MAENSGPNLGRTLKETLGRAAIQNPDMIPVLLDRGPDKISIRKVVEEIGAARFLAQRSAAADTLSLLLDRKLVDADEWVVETVAPNDCALETLLDHIPDAPVTKALFRATAIVITKDVMVALARSFNGSDEIKLMFDQVGPVQITGKVLKVALLHGRPSTSKLLLKLQRDLEPQVVLQDIWQNADIDAGAKARATMVVLEVAELGERAEILHEYPYDLDQKEDSGFQDLVKELNQSDIEGFVTPEWERLSLIQAAEGNPRANKETLLSLLAEKRGSA
ncbi:hypothetical protein BJX61DRAFT_552938 [Aspergillus egyptiacus]|nr:hypothetical protein BJX61DRAFT_552938 [Aspergillus egyptiacus]